MFASIDVSPTPIWKIVRVLVFVFGARTGRVVDGSTTGLARMPATGLLQHHSPPQVADELVQFYAEWHGLV
jgi:hypothetical protein